MPSSNTKQVHGKKPNNPMDLLIEEFTHKFHGHETRLPSVVLHPESRQVATFCTPWGNMRPKCLIFGAKTSQDLFDETIYRIFSDNPKCLNQRDDIFLVGKIWRNTTEL